MSDVSKLNPYVINTSALSKTFGGNDAFRRYVGASKTDDQSDEFGGNDSFSQYVRAKNHGIFHGSYEEWMDGQPDELGGNDSFQQYARVKTRGIFHGSYEEWMHQRKYDSGDSSSKPVNHKHASKNTSQLEEQLKYAIESNNDHRRANQIRIKENRKKKYEHVF